jgi:glutathione S-transferase
MNNMFMLAGQSYAAEKNQGVIDLLGGQVVRNVKALDRMIGKDGYAAAGRLTLADCALVPALFLIENTLGAVGVENPVPKAPNVPPGGPPSRPTNTRRRPSPNSTAAWRNARNSSAPAPSPR